MSENTTLDGFERTDDETGVFQWDPDGRPCAACGARVERLWRDDGGLRCVDCKSWT